jgi:hypothetical protein
MSFPFLLQADQSTSPATCNFIELRICRILPQTPLNYVSGYLQA